MKLVKATLWGAAVTMSTVIFFAVLPFILYLVFFAAATAVAYGIISESPEKKEGS